MARNIPYCYANCGIEGADLDFVLRAFDVDDHLLDHIHP